MILSEPFLEECVQECSISGCVAVYAPEKIRGKCFWAKVRDFERSFYDATCIDCVRFVRRDIFLKAGGFDENLTGPEDWDFDRRIRALGPVSIIRAPVYHNEGDFNFKKYLKKKMYYAGSFDQYIKKWGEKDAVIKKQLGFYYRYVGVFSENKKIFKLAAHPLLTVSMYALRIAVGLAYLAHRRHSAIRCKQ
jgi:GT2 family glycosyltransferase